MIVFSDCADRDEVIKVFENGFELPLFGHLRVHFLIDANLFRALVVKCSARRWWLSFKTTASLTIPPILKF